MGFQLEVEVHGVHDEENDGRASGNSGDPGVGDIA